MLFSPNWQRYQCPEWVVAFLKHIGDRLETVMWNRNQRQYSPPFGWGGYFKHDVFEIHGFRYPDDDEEGNPDLATAQPYNFRWSEVEISWYKGLGRGTTMNQELEPAKGIQLLDECLAAIRTLDTDHRTMIQAMARNAYAPLHCREVWPERISDNEWDFRTNRA